MKINKEQVYLRASSLSKIMTGEIGLSESEELKLEELEKYKEGKILGKNSKPLAFTKTRKKDYERLIYKRDNPELPQTAKSYLDEVVVSYLYNVEKDIYSMPLEHGTENEDISIYDFNVFLNSVMKSKFDIKLTDKIEKNTIRKWNDDLMLTGEVDIIRESQNYMIDFKNAVSAFTLDKSKEELIQDYELQGQAYCELYDMPVIYFVYTLNPTKYMDDSAYDHIKAIDRLHIHKVERKPEMIEQFKARLPLIKKYIQTKLKQLKEAKEQTVKFVLEIADLEKVA